MLLFFCLTFSTLHKLFSFSLPIRKIIISYVFFLHTSSLCRQNGLLVQLSHSARADSLTRRAYDDRLSSLRRTMTTAQEKTYIIAPIVSPLLLREHKNRRAAQRLSQIESISLKLYSRNKISALDNGNPTSLQSIIFTPKRRQRRCCEVVNNFHVAQLQFIAHRPHFFLYIFVSPLRSVRINKYPSKMFHPIRFSSAFFSFLIISFFIHYTQHQSERQEMMIFPVIDKIKISHTRETSSCHHRPTNRDYIFFSSAYIMRNNAKTRQKIHSVSA